MVAGILYIVCVLVFWFVFYAFFFEELASKSYDNFNTIEGLLASGLCAMVWPLVVWGFLIWKFTPVVKGWKEKIKLCKEQENEPECD